MSICNHRAYLFLIHSVAQGHQAVAHMNVFNYGVLVLACYIIMTEIPVAFNSLAVKAFYNKLNTVSWHTQNCGVYCAAVAKAFDFFVRPYFYSAQNLSCKVRVFIKNSDKLKPSCLKMHMLCNCRAQVSCADYYRLELPVKTEHLADFKLKLFYAVAVALLTEAAEAV